MELLSVSKTRLLTRFLTYLNISPCFALYDTKYSPAHSLHSLNKVFLKVVSYNVRPHRIMTHPKIQSSVDHCYSTQVHSSLGSGRKCLHFKIGTDSHPLCNASLRLFFLSYDFNYYWTAANLRMCSWKVLEQRHLCFHLCVELWPCIGSQIGNENNNLLGNLSVLQRTPAWREHHSFSRR